MLSAFGDINIENFELLEQYNNLFSQNPEKLDTSWQKVFSEQSNNQEVARSQELYRTWGHLQAKIYPEGITGLKPAKGMDLYDEHFDRIYCGSIGYDFYPHCSSEVCEYIISRVEPLQGQIPISQKVKLEILHLLNKAESFETFLHTKYVGQKRFSLEGAETLIPMLYSLLEKEVSSIVIGMPHRGRLNVLVNILGKTYKQVFSEFEDVAPDTFETSGDVKYHKGYSALVGNKKVLLAANPSHLESVNSVVEGMTRGYQKEQGKEQVLPVLVHGDAAISGQGVVYETLQMSGLNGYTTGGTIHIVTNNHIGFTTLPEDSRSTTYCTDIAKAFGAPVFHVNAEDPEACVFAMNLAFDIRQKFGVDVFIDLNCYRKYGHNEGDEPAFTQPLLYKVIRQKPSIRSKYHDALEAEGLDLSKLDQEFKNELQEAHEATVTSAKKIKEAIPARKIANHRMHFNPYDTKVSKKKISEALDALTAIPEGFSLHPRIQKIIEARKDAKELDWALAEALAFATLLQDKVSIRLAGQDSRRGTFSQRHGVWIDQQTGNQYVPHASISENFEVFDSFLSEYAALGFEYGYSLVRSKDLVLWEAQFGDFANGAQIIIDQYLAPGEQKWGVKSKLTLLLPHGYEGQGPEHSSARIERYLTLCAEDNLYVTYPTTPAQYFHLLRRQAKVEKPLIVFTPKGLLRLPECTSSFDALSEGTFSEVLDDDKDPKKVERLIFCTGRIYYDLASHADSATAIIRIEQLYPFHKDRLEEVIARYKKARIFIWAQEEPYNMGARGYIHELIEPLLPKKSILEYRGRTASSSPACGSHLVHEKESEMIHDSIYGGTK